MEDIQKRLKSAVHNLKIPTAGKNPERQDLKIESDHPIHGDGVFC